MTERCACGKTKLTALETWGFGRLNILKRKVIAVLILQAQVQYILMVLILIHQ